MNSKFSRALREFSHDGSTFQLPVTQDCMLAFSRILYDEEMLIVYNSSLVHDDEEYIGVDSHLNPDGAVFRYVYGRRGKIHVLKNEDGSRRFVKVNLKPSEFVILTNQTINVE